MNIFIGTGFGFIKGVKFDKVNGSTEIEYTPHLRYAQTFKANGAKAFMRKHDIVGFLFNPYAQEAVRDMYEVKKDGFSWNDNDKNAIKEWKVQRAIMVNENDANWLQSKKLAGRDLLTFEEATQKAIDLNQAMLAELQQKLDYQHQGLVLAKINANEQQS